MKRPVGSTISNAADQVPILRNLGTQEGFSVANSRFNGVWPEAKVFFEPLRAQGALIGTAIDPLTSHECGNQRYLAIPWPDACLTARLPVSNFFDVVKRADLSSQGFLWFDLTAIVSSR